MILLDIRKCVFLLSKLLCFDLSSNKILQNDMHNFLFATEQECSYRQYLKNVNLYSKFSACIPAIKP